MTIKILAFTSNRADYDLLSSLYRRLHCDQDIEFKLFVSGAHLSRDYGYSVEQIRADGFPILLELETLMGYDSHKSKLKSTGMLLLGAIDLVANFSPDVVLFAGDREDVIAIALLGVYLGIPTIHFYGGDHELAGHEDSLIRHATSKLASLHFVSCTEHANRLLALGEKAHRIMNIGSIALDKFHEVALFDKEQVFSHYAIDNKNKKIALVIYHPSPDETENALADQVMNAILSAIIERDMIAFVGSPNTDEGNKKIIRCLERYQHHEQVVIYKNMPRALFLSLFTVSSFIIGNSSAGLLESASIPVAAINVGHRQQGRLCAENVIFCHYEKSDITQAIEKALSDAFQASLGSVVNLFGNGHSAEQAHHLIKTLDLASFVRKSEDPLYD
jgi:UDP-N-acetylglucosamine 2-epimerase (non-hydrolysing)/GDP/UDP-N,N'-diacetylbacillosamine 2-epimerase (hydrolysing)